jgi:hypothetical protein
MVLSSIPCSTEQTKPIAKIVFFPIVLRNPQILDLIGPDGRMSNARLSPILYICSECKLFWPLEQCRSIPKDGHGNGNGSGMVSFEAFKENHIAFWALILYKKLLVI